MNVERGEELHTQRRIIFNKEALKEFRVSRGMNQADLAELLDTNLNVVSYWETGRRTPLPKTINKMVEATGITHEEFYIVNHETLGTKLTTMRLKQNISQRDMASMIETSPENLNRWEADNHVPSTYFVYQLSKALGVSMEELITDESGELIISDPHG